MNRDEFLTGIESLTRVYGDKAYPPERIDIIWQRVKYRHQVVWFEAIDNLIADNPHAPLLKKILDECSTVQHNHPELSNDPYKSFREELAKAQHEGSQCLSCLNTGVITGYRKDIEGNPAQEMLCTCHLGSIAQKLPENRALPFWRIGFEKTYMKHAEWLRRADGLERYQHIYRMHREERLGELEKILNLTNMMPTE